MPIVEPLNHNCPKCDREMVYITSVGPGNLTHIYDCPVHGRWSLPLHTEPTPEPQRASNPKP